MLKKLQEVGAILLYKLIISAQLEIKINFLKTDNEGKVISGKLNELYKELDEIANASKDITNLTNLAKSIALQSEGNITQAKQIIEHAQKTLAVNYYYQMLSLSNTFIYFYYYFFRMQSSIYTLKENLL